MRKSFGFVLAAALAGAASLHAGPAYAASIVGGNALQTSDSIYYDLGGKAVTLTDTDGVGDDATAFLFLELASFAGSNTFGIYGFTDTGAGIVLGDTLQIFSGSASPLTSRTIAFNVAAGTATVGGVTRNIGTTFGFYLSGPGGTFYSHQSLNADAVDHMLMFDTSLDSGDLLGSDVVVSFEDLGGGGDLDFDDLVVGISDVRPVPEPGSMMLLGTGLFGLAGVVRRRLRRA